MGEWCVCTRESATSTFPVAPRKAIVSREVSEHNWVWAELSSYLTDSYMIIFNMFKPYSQNDTDIENTEISFREE